MDFSNIDYAPWKVVRLIGHGSFGSVYEIQREEFGEVYRAALKVISIPKSDNEIMENRADGMDNESMTSYYSSVVKELTHEFALLNKMKGNTNVVGYEDHKVVPHADGIGWDIYIRMELLTSLTKVSSRYAFSRDEVLKIGIDICEALSLCEKQNIIHRDIKPDNIFISENGDYKLGDFGIARTASKTMSNMSRKGTPNYMAPEIYKNEPYNQSVDIYSLGIVLYQLMNGKRLPFIPVNMTIQDREASLGRRLSGEPFPMPENADPAFANVILKACAYDPRQRYNNADEMKADLQRLLNGKKVPPIDVAAIMADNDATEAYVSGPANLSESFVNDSGTMPVDVMSGNNGYRFDNAQPENNYNYGNASQNNMSGGNYNYGNAQADNNYNYGNASQNNMSGGNNYNYGNAQADNNYNYGNASQNNMTGGNEYNYGNASQNNMTGGNEYNYGNASQNNMTGGNDYNYGNASQNNMSGNLPGGNDNIPGNAGAGPAGGNVGEEGANARFANHVPNPGGNGGGQTKKMGKGPIIGGAVAAVALIILLASLMGRGGSSGSNTAQTPATQAPATEAPATEAPATEAPATEAPATEAAASSGQSYLTDSLDDYIFELEGKFYKLPFRYSDFKANGWSLVSTDYSPATEEDEITAGEYEMYRMSNGAVEIYVDIYNASGNVKALKDCNIGGITIEAKDNLDFKVAGGLTCLSTVEEVQEKFGIPDSSNTYDTNTTLTYKTGDYSADGETRFSIYSDRTTNNSIELNYRPVTKEDITEISNERPDYLATYKAPTQLSSDPTETIFQLDGKLYQLPCTLNEFTDAGWTVSEKKVDGVPGKNKESYALEISKNGYSLNLGLANYSNNACTPENCAVYSVDVTKTNRDGSMPADYMTFSGGYNLGTSEADLDKILASFEKNDKDDYASYNYYNQAYTKKVRVYLYQGSNNYTSFDVSLDNEEWNYQ